jgi:hypothetical protein
VRDEADAVYDWVDDIVSHAYHDFLVPWTIPGYQIHKVLYVRKMSLVSGPGRAGVSALPEDLQLVIEPHVKYIQSLDSVCFPCSTVLLPH